MLISTSETSRPASSGSPGDRDQHRRLDRTGDLHRPEPAGRGDSQHWSAGRFGDRDLVVHGEIEPGGGRARTARSHRHPLDGEPAERGEQVIEVAVGWARDQHPNPTLAGDHRVGGVVGGEQVLTVEAGLDSGAGGEGELAVDDGALVELDKFLGCDHTVDDQAECL